MKKSHFILPMCMLACTGYSTAYAEDAGDATGFQVGVGAKAGTLGFGVEVSVPIIQDTVNVRAGFNTFDADYDEESDSSSSIKGLDYEGDLSLQSFPLLVDWHPFSGGFRLSAGLIFNSNEITAKAECGDANCEFGDMTFTAAQLGTTKLAVDLGGTQPYLGLGYGNSVSSNSRLSFVFDLGVVFQDVSIKLTPSAACEALTACRDEADREEAELKDDVEDFDMYPVLAVGLSYKFK